MLTCKSPRKVMLVAHHLACQCLPRYSSKFSRHDFTLRQLFACLVLREHQRQSYRGCEALLRDAEHWCHAIGMRKAPDHNTLCRAFGVVVTGRLMGKALDVLARWFSLAKVLRLSTKPLSMDTTYFESRHVSRHYERRRAQTKAAAGPSEAEAESREMAEAGGSPGGRWRRHMKRLLRTKRSRRRCGYTQRWQSETVNSMVKRNLGSALRARTPQRRECEMLLRAVVHDIMLLRRRRGEGRDRAGHSQFPATCECP